MTLTVDYVFVDCPPSLGLLTVNALVAAHEVLIPIQCEYYALEGLGQLLRNIELVQSHLNPALWVSTILLTMYTEEHHVLEALRAGVNGCVLKTQAAEYLIQAIREVCAGGVYLSPSVSGAVVQAYLTKSDLPYDPLTDRERQVLQLVAEGKRTKEIALILGVTAKTAETHRVKVMEKLDIHSTAGLVRYAIRRGLIEA